MKCDSNNHELIQHLNTIEITSSDEMLQIG